MDATADRLNRAWEQHQIYIRREIATRQNLEEACEEWEEALRTKSESANLCYKTWKSCLHEWVAARERLVHSAVCLDGYIQGLKSG